MGLIPQRKHLTSVQNVCAESNRQRFRIEPGMEVRIGRLVKVLRIFGHATEGTANSHGFFEGGIETERDD
jgi:hypothetical protein